MCQLKNSMKCRECQNEFNGYRTARFCSKKCQKQYNDKLYWKKRIEKSHLEFSNEEDLNIAYVECPICKFRSKDLASHPKVHGLTQVEYRAKCGEIKSESTKDGVRGENNPWFNHGGTLSPYSKNFINYKDVDNRDEIIAALQKKSKETARANCNNPMTLDYYLSRGFSDNDAAEKLRDRQTTFSLEKCIERHGIEVGTKIWNDRQAKWQTTLNTKSDSEKLEINRKKSTKINFKSLWSKTLDCVAYLYLIKISDTSYKIGLTSRDSIDKRYHRNDLRSIELILFGTSTINHVFQIEQLIKNKYKQNINRDDYGVFGWTEVLNKIDLQILLSDINLLLSDMHRTENEFNAIFKK